MNKVTIYPNGPAVINFTSAEEPIQITHEDKSVDYKVGMVIALCRCGKSKDKVFCDGSHKSPSLL